MQLKLEQPGRSYSNSVFRQRINSSRNKNKLRNTAEYDEDSRAKLMAISIDSRRKCNNN